MFLLDTNVVSALRRPERAPKVVDWLTAHRQAHIVISAIVLGEIEHGIALQRKRNPDFATDLAVWAAGLRSAFGDRILPFDKEDAIVWGQLGAKLGHKNPDLMIAAQALTREATVVTRNLSHFVATGAQVVDPF